MRWLLRLAWLARMALWGFLTWGVWLGSKVAMVALLAVLCFAVELLIRTSPVVIPMSRTGQHRKGSDGEE